MFFTQKSRYFGVFSKTRKYVDIYRPPLLAKFSNLACYSVKVIVDFTINP